MFGVVYVFGPYEHFVEVYSQFIFETSYTHTDTIRIRSWLLLALFMAGIHLPKSQERHTCPKTWHTISDQGGDNDNDALGSFSDWRSLAERFSDRTYTSVYGAYHQRFITSFHRFRIQSRLQHPLSAYYLPVFDTTHSWSHAGVFG